MILPSAKLAPRLTMSQQAIPTDANVGIGVKDPFLWKAGFGNVECDQVIRDTA